MTIVSSERLPRRLREFVGSSPSEDMPVIADVYKAGKSIGLSKKEIDRVCRQTNRGTGVRDFIARHWAVLLPVTLLAILIISVLLPFFSGSRSSYPSGTLYSVVSPNDFKKRLSISSTGSHV
jgi:hypothetical protein